MRSGGTLFVIIAMLGFACFDNTTNTIFIVLEFTKKHMVSEAQVLVIKMYIIFDLPLQPSVEILAKLSFCEQ